MFLSGGGRRGKEERKDHGTGGDVCDQQVDVAAETDAGEDDQKADRNDDPAVMDRGTGPYHWIAISTIPALPDDGAGRSVIRPNRSRRSSSSFSRAAGRRIPRRRS